MYFLGHIAAIFIGISLGLIGAGGSILTVPVLVYLIGIAPMEATGYSLFIVGLTAAIGCVSYATKGLLNYRTAILFGIPSVIGVFIARWFIVPLLPEKMFSVFNVMISKNIFIMLTFAILMIYASSSMIVSGVFPEVEKKDGEQHLPLLMTEGVGTGILTGFVGVGGGFLITPALVILAKMKMKAAIGTSLFIIAINSFIGFLLSLKTNPNSDWQFLFIFSLFAVSGIFVGNYISKFISGQKLKPVFGWFILVMGVYIIIKELFISPV
jgi:uncharacterized membrane protein YfcA